MRVCKAGLRPRFPAGAPPEFVSLAEDCWHADPAARPCFVRVCERLEAVAAVHPAPLKRGPAPAAAGL